MGKIPPDRGTHGVHKPESQGPHRSEGFKSGVNKTDKVAIHGFNRNGSTQVAVGATKAGRGKPCNFSASKGNPSKTIAKAASGPLGTVLMQKSPAIVNVKNTAYRNLNRMIGTNRRIRTTENKESKQSVSAEVTEIPPVDAENTTRKTSTLEKSFLKDKKHKAALSVQKNRIR